MVKTEPQVRQSVGPLSWPASICIWFGSLHNIPPRRPESMEGIYFYIWSIFLTTFLPPPVLNFSQCSFKKSHTACSSFYYLLTPVARLFSTLTLKRHTCSMVYIAKSDGINRRKPTWRPSLPRLCVSLGRLLVEDREQLIAIRRRGLVLRALGDGALRLCIL